MTENNNVLSVEELDLKRHSFILLASKRMSGKSKMVINLIKYFIDKYSFSAIILFSDTAIFTDDYKFLD